MPLGETQLSCRIEMARAGGIVLAVVSLIALNMALFAVLAGFAFLRGIRAPTGQTRSLALSLAMVSGAFSLGAGQRLGLQMYRTGLIDGDISESILFEFQLLKSLLALTAGVATAVLLARSLRDFRNSERLVRVFTEHVGVVGEVSDLGLTPRELEVLALVGRGLISDVAVVLCWRWRFHARLDTEAGGIALFAPNALLAKMIVGVRTLTDQPGDERQLVELACRSMLSNTQDFIAETTSTPWLGEATELPLPDVEVTDTEIWL